MKAEDAAIGDRATQRVKKRVARLGMMSAMQVLKSVVVVMLSLARGGSGRVVVYVVGSAY